MLVIIVLIIVLCIVLFSIGTFFGYSFCEKRNYDELYGHYQKRIFDKCLKENRENEIKLDGYFLRNNYKNIVVYGLGIYYDEFVKQIDSSRFNIYLADKSAQTIHIEGEKIYSISDLVEQDIYDVIVITSYNHYKEIEEELESAGISKEMISYRDLILNATKER